MSAVDYSDIAGACLLTGQSRSRRWSWYAKAEFKMGMMCTNGIPGLPGSNNFKVMEAGARKLGYKEVHTGRMSINSQPRDGRGACQQIEEFLLSGMQVRSKMVDALHRKSRKVRRPAISRFGQTAWRCGYRHDASGKANGVVYVDGDGKMQKQKTRVVAVAGNSLESLRHRYSIATPTCFRTDSRIPPARSAAITCVT